jgi:RNA polymerase sigma-70 factor (ECF subfamily)
MDEFDQHRGLLFGIAYRMLGSVAEAEDIVQEAGLRWLQQSKDEVRSPKAWLVAATTRLCIDQLRSARRQREEYYGVWLPEPLVRSSAPAVDENAAMADSLTMAFMVMLESLSPVERAAFLLREVFDYDYDAIAEIVGKSEVNCRQIVRRAKTELQERPPTEPIPDSRARLLAERFLDVSTTGTAEDLIPLLTEDAVLYSDGGGKVVAAGRPIESRDHVARFLIGIRRGRPADLTMEAAWINGRPGTITISEGQVTNVIAFDFNGDRVQTIYIIRNPDKLAALTRNLNLKGSHDRN